ncbi:MAG: restriction endonuclease subunit S, partial [Paraclostridium sp.]
MEELKDGWRNLKLKEVLSLKRGYDLPSRDRKNGKYKIIASSNENGFHNEFKVEGPGVVTGRSGTLGIVQYVNDKFWPLNTTLYVNDFKGNNKKFIYYFLQILKLENYKTGTTVPTLNRNHILDLEIKLPLLETQEKIASILS